MIDGKLVWDTDFSERHLADIQSRAVSQEDAAQFILQHFQQFVDLATDDGYSAGLEAGFDDGYNEGCRDTKAAE